ncbi:MAG: TadE/TadG family type IV pilus assembly protein [Terracidiphilus sp.]
MRRGFGLSTVSRALARRMNRVLGLRSEEGSELVEFAMALPALMLVLTGTASFSLGLYYLQQIDHATSGAAQLVGAEAGFTTNPCTTVEQSVTAALPKVSPGLLTFKVVITDSSGDTHPYGPWTGSSSPSSCSSGASEMAPNEPVTVTVSYAYKWFPILKFSPSSPLTSSESALAE